MTSEKLKFQSRGAGADCQWNRLRSVLRVKPLQNGLNFKIAKSWLLAKLSARRLTLSRMLVYYFLSHSKSAPKRIRNLHMFEQIRPAQG